MLRACPAENYQNHLETGLASSSRVSDAVYCLIQVRLLRPLVRWCQQQPNGFKGGSRKAFNVLFQMDVSLSQ